MKNFDVEYEYEMPKRDLEGKLIVDEDGIPEVETVTVSRNSRLDRDRQFVIGGETFVHRAAVAPESVTRYSKLGSGEIEGLTEEIAIEIYDETVCAFLEPGQDEKWAKVRAAEVENPITATDMRALIRWLYEVTSGRPTVPPSLSTAGSQNGETGTSSKDESSSPALAAV